MKRILGIAALSFFAASFSACSSNTPESVESTRSGLDRVNTKGLLRVSELAAKAGASPLKDDAAAQEFQALERLVAAGRSADLVLGVYEIEPAPADPRATAAERAKELGLGGEPTERGRFVVVHDPGGRELRLNTDSGAEFVSDLELFHQGPGVKEVRSDADYVAAAESYVKAALGKVVGRTPTFVYKIRYYKNSEAPEGQSGATESTYQVAVAFDTTIDDLPVIGAGGKIAVHLTPEGKIIGHETTVRAAGALRATIPGSEIVPPGEAVKALEAQLRRRGVDLSRYRLTRSELGYARLGRDSWQSVVAPHYGFVWEPTEGEGLKKVVELTPAFKSPAALALVDRDTAAENSRKRDRAKLAGDESKR